MHTLASGTEALAVELDTVRNCVAAISRVFLVCSKDNLNDRDLVASIAAAELPETSLVALTSSYKSARAEMRELAKAGITQLPSFQGFDWRLDIEMSRRGAHHVAQPVYMLRVDSVSAHSVAADASAAAASPMGASSMYLQSDYANLAQLHDSLSAALEESTTQHASRVERYIR